MLTHHYGISVIKVQMSLPRESPKWHERGDTAAFAGYPLGGDMVKLNHNVKYAK